jgi:hypothetical protein
VGKKLPTRLPTNNSNQIPNIQNLIDLGQRHVFPARMGELGMKMKGTKGSLA